MSFLDAIPGQIFAALSADLRPGTLTKFGPGGKDSLGNPRPGKPVKYQVRGFVGSFSESTRRLLSSERTGGATVQQDDVSITILLHGLQVNPERDDTVQIFGPVGGGRQYSVVQIVSIDPARASAELHGRPVE